MLEFPPDITALYEALLFVALYFVLKSLVFDRFLGAVEKRRERSEGALAEAKRLRDEAAVLRSEQEAALAEVGREAARARDELRQQAAAEERSLIEAAREDAARTLEALRVEVAREIDAARRSLEGEVQALAERMAQTILGENT